MQSIILFANGIGVWRGGASLPRLFPSHITEDMLRSPFRPAFEICRFDSEEVFFVVPILHAADFQIIFRWEKLVILSCLQILAAISSADDKPLIRFQLRQKLLGSRQQLTYIMGMQLKDLRKQDYKTAIQYAIKGMHLDWYVKNKTLLNLYGTYFWYLELNRATQIIAAYEGDTLAGILLADIQGENKLRYSPLRVPFVNDLQDKPEGLDVSVLSTGSVSGLPMALHPLTG